LVGKRTALILSLQSMHARTLGQPLSCGEAKGLSVAQARKHFAHPADRLVSGLDAQLIGQLSQSIQQIEKLVLAMTKSLPRYQVLHTLPGVGRILGLTITLETADVKRFATAGDYASYCRCVDTRRLSNGKKKGENNSKFGNKYLAWAYVEAANFAKRYDLQCRQFHDRKSARTNPIVATKALACKLAKAAWHMMSEQVAYDPARMFPAATTRLLRETAGKDLSPENRSRRPAGQGEEKSPSQPAVFGSKAALGLLPSRALSSAPAKHRITVTKAGRKTHLGTGTGNPLKGVGAKP
jgi:transposase